MASTVRWGSEVSTLSMPLPLLASFDVGLVLAALWSRIVYAKRYAAYRAFCWMAPRTFAVLASAPGYTFGWSVFDKIFKAVVVHITTLVAQAMANAFTTALDAGTAGIITIYTGTIPTDADTAIGAQTLLATLTFSASSFGAATDGNPGGLITAAAITSDSSADATGTAAWARILTQAGGTTIADVNVGTTATTMVFNTVSFTSGSAIACSAFTFTMPES